MYISNVRSILKYAIQVRWDIPEYLSDRIDCIQKRALKIIYPELCTAYNQGLLEANISSLAKRRVSLCRRLSLMTSKHDNPQALNHCPIPKSATRTVSYNLRSGSERTINKFKKNYKRANNFLHLDILKLDYLLYTPSIVMLYFLACIHIYHLFIQYLFNSKKVK